MSRTVPAAIITALTQPVCQPFYAAEMLFDTAPLRIWTGYGDRTIDGQTYTGAGTLLSISGLEEVDDLSARAATLVLSGIPTSVVSLTLAEPFQNRPCRIMFGVRDVPDFVEVFSGRINTMDLTYEADTCRIELMVDSKLVLLERENIRRYTHESHTSRYPGDTFLSFVADLQDKDVPWGKQPK